MILVVNIGNSSIRFGVGKNHKELTSWTINTKPFKTADELFLMFKNMYVQHDIDYKQISGIVIGSVVPHQTTIVSRALFEIHGIKAMVVDRNTPSNVIQHSNQMGTDLYANAVAAHELYPGNKIVVDFGTALTVLGIMSSGEVMGVVIAPGVITSLKALVGDTSQLPDIELTPPASVLGKNTEACMQSGMVYGYIGMVEGLVERITQEFEQSFYVISTGGLGHIFNPLTQTIDSDDKLHTLRGLCLLYEQNRDK